MKIVRITLFVLGSLLLAINVTGLFMTMRNSELYSLEHEIKNRVNDVVIKYPEIKDLLVRKDGESNTDFAVRANSTIHDGFAHYWRREGIDRFHLRVPVWENYLLNFASYVNPKRYERYEFTDYKKNLERGVGLCSTHSIVLKGVLKEHGIKAELLDVGGRHVVVRAEVSDTSAYLLDPDYGVAVPYDTAAVKAHPELVRLPYSEMDKLYYAEAKDPYTTDFIVEIYGISNHVYDVNNAFEPFSYWAIWILPILLMLPFLVYKLKS